MTAVRQLSLNLGSASHVDVLHHAHESGVSLAIKNGDSWIENNYRKQEAIKLAETLPFAGVDCYLTQNPIKVGKRRCMANLSALNAFYVDLDTYNSIYAELETEDIIDKVFQQCDKLKLPRPTLAGSSGRGVQIVWCFSTIKPISFIGTWQEIEHDLITAFKAFGADKNASDASRVLRLSGTVNTKNNAIASFGVVSEPIKYESMRAWHNDIKKNKPVKLKVVRTNKARATDKNIYTLAYGRMKDLETLAEMRNGFSDGRRRASTIYSQALSWFYRDDDAREKELQGFINTCLHEPHRYKTRATKGTLLLHDDKRIKLKNKTIIDWLDITPEEQKSLIAIVGKDEKKRRAEVKRRERGDRLQSEYLEQLNGNKKKTAQSRTQLALELRSQGLKQQQIADQLGVSTRTIRAYLSNEK